MLFDTNKQILLNLLAGTGVKPNYLYLEYTSADTVPSYSVGSADSNHFTDLSAAENFLRIPITITPTVEGNTVTYSVFFANTATGALLSGHAPFGVNCKIYAVALVAGESSGDYTKDMLFGYQTVNPVLTTAGNQQLAIQFKLSL